MINQLMGGLAVMPWEIDDVSAEWLDAMQSLAEDLPKMRRMVTEQERTRDEWLKKSNYRGYLKKRK